MISFSVIIDLFQRNILFIFLDFLITFIYLAIFKILSVTGDENDSYPSARDNTRRTVTRWPVDPNFVPYLRSSKELLPLQLLLLLLLLDPWPKIAFRYFSWTGTSSQLAWFSGEIVDRNSSHSCLFLSLYSFTLSSKLYFLWAHFVSFNTQLIICVQSFSHQSASIRPTCAIIMLSALSLFNLEDLVRLRTCLADFVLFQHIFSGEFQRVSIH